MGAFDSFDKLTDAELLAGLKGLKGLKGSTEDKKEAAETWAVFCRGAIEDRMRKRRVLGLPMGFDGFEDTK